MVSEGDEKKSRSIANLIDKINKISTEEFEKELKALGIDTQNIKGINQYLRSNWYHNWSSRNPNISFPIKSNSFDDTGFMNLFKKGLYEMDAVITMIEKITKALNIEIQFLFDPKIIRGLDYYTGTIFEATFDQMPSLGSICGGGRYANLTWYIDAKRQDYCGVWGSIGISRILSRIFDETELKQQTIADYLIVNFENSFETWLSLIAHLKSQGHTFEYYPHPDKLGKQFAYADKKGIPFVIICGEGEKEQGIYKIKDMKTGEESIHKL